MSALEVSQLDAIDVHAHVEVDGHGHQPLPHEFIEASSKYFAAERHAPSLGEIAEYHRERRMAAVVFSVDIESATGHRALSNEEIAEHADALIPFVAVDFPDLTIIMAHPSFPWQDEALAVATHKPKVYIDLSGWSPKYFPPQLVQYANTLLQDKVLFGSDYPLITPDRWRSDVANLAIKDHVRPKILKENAIIALGLDRKESA